MYIKNFCQGVRNSNIIRFVESTIRGNFFMLFGGIFFVGFFEEFFGSRKQLRESQTLASLDDSLGLELR